MTNGLNNGGYKLAVKDTKKPVKRRKKGRKLLFSIIFDEYKILHWKINNYRYNFVLSKTKLTCKIFI